jgi:hypothetical protein
MADFPLYKRTDIYEDGHLTRSWHMTRKSALQERPRTDRKRDRDKRPNHITMIEVDEHPPKNVREFMK